MSATTTDLAGVHVAAVTPFRRDLDLSVDVDSYLAHLRWLAGRGVDGLVCFGTNGEGPSMGTDETWGVAREVATAGLGPQLTITVAEGSLTDTLLQLERLNGLPLAAVMVLPPYYFTPVTLRGLRRFYERVVTVSHHPVIVYHIPKYAVPVPAELIGDLAVWGVKDSGGDGAYTDQVLAGGRGVLLGTEGAIRTGLSRGAVGLVSALANVVPEQVVALATAVRAGDQGEAARLEAALLALRARTKTHASPAVLKRLAEHRHGHPMGTVRPPLEGLPQDYDAASALRDARGPS